MAKQISTGIEKIAQNISEKEKEQSHKQWREFRNKIDSILLSGNQWKTDEVRVKCLKLDSMNLTERAEFITTTWGINYYNKVQPLLIQLSKIEESIATRG